MLHEEVAWRHCRVQSWGLRGPRKFLVDERVPSAVGSSVRARGTRVEFSKSVDGALGLGEVPTGRRAAQEGWKSAPAGRRTRQRSHKVMKRVSCDGRASLAA